MKFNKTFKKSISIILTIIMILSTFGSAIIPAGAANTSENTSSADTYYFWYGDANVLGNSASHINDWKQDANRITMTTGDDGNTYYCEHTLTKDKDLFFVINTSDSSAANNTVIWKSYDAVKNNLSYASGVNKNRDFYIQNYTVGSTQYYYPNIGVASNQKLRFTFTPSTNKVVVSPAGGSQEETTAPTNPPTGNVYVYFEKGDYNWSKVYAYIYVKNSQPVKENQSWPGVEMTYNQNLGLYEYNVPENLENGTVIFNNGNGTQLPDQDINGVSHKYTKDKTWVVYNPVTPTDPTDPTNPSETTGAYKIKDVTPDHGSLSFKAEGKKAGTADAGNTVTITANPHTAFTLNKLTAVYEDANGKEVELEVINNQFIMPAAKVEVSATFTINKAEWVAAQGSGLWFDAAPSITDTSATLIKWNNYTGTSHSTRSNYVFYVPKDVTHTDTTVTINIYNGFDKDVTINDVEIEANKTALVTLNKGTTYNVTGIDKKVEVMLGSSASIYFHTVDKNKNDYDLPTKINASGVEAENKDSVKADSGTCVTVDGANNAKSMVLDQIKGRGNSSWKASTLKFGKYAYNMKLENNTNLLDILEKGEKAKSYCLLANNADESMLRNALTYDLAKNIGLYNSPEFKFVDMYDNGEYHGTYFICEKVDVGEKKLVKGEAFDDINEDAVTEANPNAEVNETKNSGTYSVTYNGKTLNGSMQYCTVGDSSVVSGIPSSTVGTYLLEFEIEERYHKEASWFKSPLGQYVVVKSPEYATKEQVKYVAERFAKMEYDIFSSSNATLSTLEPHMNLDSFAKMYLIQELSSNLDAASTSYYITLDCSNNVVDENGVLVTDNAKFVASPVWDYDWAYGQYEKQLKKDVSNNSLDPDNPEVWFAKNKAKDDSTNSNRGYSIQSKLANNANFQSVIKKVWNGTTEKGDDGFYAIARTYITTLVTWRDQIADSMTMNEYRWGFIKNDPLRSDPNDNWGSQETGDTLNDTVDYLINWIDDRTEWLNQNDDGKGYIQEWANYKQTVTPILKAYAADGTTELTGEVAQGDTFKLKATTTETYVTYKLYDGNNEIASNLTGEFTISNATSGTHNYTVKTVTHSGNEKPSNQVTVTVSGDPVETVVVPDVSNMTMDQARAKLLEVGLALSDNYTESYHATIEKDKIISSTPSAGQTVNKGTTVTVVISLGQKPMVIVPDVVGENKANAITQLEALGLTVKVTTQSSDVEAGIVISSTPGKDESVEIGTEVTIVVSTGPVEKVTINNVKIRFKGTNLKNLTPKFTFNGETVEISRLSKNDGGYIGTYFTGAYGFYWWEATLDSVTVGEDNVLKFTTTGSDMNASLTYDFAGCQSDSILFFAVNNMYSGTELENISGDANSNKRTTFRSAGNMVSNANYAEDPTPSRVMLSLLDAAGVATTKAYTVGDTNADGNVNIKDATLAQMMTAGIVSGSDTNNLLGDYDISGDVNIKDATGIQSYIVNY